MTHLPPNLPAVVQQAAPFVSQYGYLGTGGLLLLESAGLPIPGEVTLIVAALFAGIGQLNILLVVLIGLISVIIGSSLAFLIGSLIGRTIIERYGKYILLPKERFTKYEKMFNRNGPKLVIIARFVEGLRQLNGYIAGISEMTFSKYLFYNSIGSVVWVAAWSTASYYAGSHIKTLLKYDLYLSVLVGIFVIIYIVRKIIISKKHKTIAKEN